MKKDSMQFLKGLTTYTLAGALLGCVFWATRGYALAPVFLALGGGLFFSHRQWLRRINNSDDDIKINQIT
jgi:hypothetical protein